MGPYNIADTDVVTILYLITNLSYVDPGQMEQDAIKIGGAVLGAASAAIGAAAGGIGTVIGGIVGGILNGIAQGLAMLVGGGQQNCNGAVASSLDPPIAFSGAQLETTVDNPIPGQQNITLFTTTIVNSGLSEPSPGGCGTPNTDVMWSILRDISPQDIFPASPPPAMGKLKPLPASISTQDWIGIWGYGQFINNSRILCTIGASGSGPVGVSSEDRAASYAAGLLDSIQPEPATGSLVGQDARVTRGGALTIAHVPAEPRAVSSGAAVVMPVTARYSANITEYLGSVGGPIAEQIATINLVEIPMLALPFTGDVYAPLRPIEAVATPAQAVVAGGSPPAPSSAPFPARAVISTSTRALGSTTAPVAGRGAAIASPALAIGHQSTLITLIYAATLVTSSDTLVQLYGVVGAGGVSPGTVFGICGRPEAAASKRM